MPRRKRNAKKRGRDVTLEELFELEVGPGVVDRAHLRPEVIDGVTMWSCFDSEAERKATWRTYRDFYVADAVTASDLPWAWHHYEGGKLPAGVSVDVVEEVSA